MLITIENDALTACIESRGAELVSLVYNPSGREIVWQPESGQWPGRSPILFPIVGAQKNGYYIFDGDRYEMPRHGFAMNREFICESKSSSNVVFALKDDPNSRSQYPFSFCLKVRFFLDQTTLNVLYRVENHSDYKMPYCIGGHTAYLVPFMPGTRYDDYYIEFEKQEIAYRYPLVDGMLNGREPLLVSSNTLPLSFPLFSQGAVVFKDLVSRAAILKGKNSAMSVQVSFPDFDYLALWNLPEQEFLCIEPWQGCTSSHDDSQELHKKDGICFLDPNEYRDHQHSITIRCE